MARWHLVRLCARIIAGTCEYVSPRSLPVVAGRLEQAVLDEPLGGLLGVVGQDDVGARAAEAPAAR